MERELEGGENILDCLIALFPVQGNWVTNYRAPGNPMSGNEATRPRTMHDLGGGQCKGGTSRRAKIAFTSLTV